MKTLYMNVALFGPLPSGKGTQCLQDGFLLQNVARFLEIIEAGYLFIFSALVTNKTSILNFAITGDCMGDLTSGSGQQFTNFLVNFVKKTKT